MVWGASLSAVALVAATVAWAVLEPGSDMPGSVTLPAIDTVRPSAVASTCPGVAGLGIPLWCVALAGSESAPAVAGDRLYVADADELLAVDEKTGTVVWRRASGLSRFSAPAVHDHVIVVGDARTGSARAFDLEEGVPTWTSERGLLPSRPEMGSTRTFVPARAGGLVALDVGSGRESWRALESRPVVGMALPTRHEVLVTTPDMLVAVSAATGRVRWQVPARDGDQLRTGARVAEGRAFIGASGAALYVVELPRQRVVDRFDRAGPTGVRPEHVDDRVIGVSTAGAVYGLGVSDGSLRWLTILPTTGVRDLTSDAGSVYVTSADRVFAVDARSGQRTWSADVTAVAGPIGRGDRFYVNTGRALMAVDRSG